MIIIIDYTLCDYGRGQNENLSRDWRPWVSDPQTSLFDRFLLEVGDFHHPLIKKQVLGGVYTVRRHFLRRGCVNAKTCFALRDSMPLS